MNQWEHGELAAEKGRPLSEVRLTFGALDFVAQWRRCGMTADFVAQYFSYAFEKRDIATSVLSTVINELVENAAKFTADKSRNVEVHVLNFGDEIRIGTRNWTDAKRAKLLREALERLAAAKDLDRLFAEQVERSSGEGASASGLGLILMVKDYGAQLRVGVNGVGDELEVAVQVTLTAAEVEQR